LASLRIRIRDDCGMGTSLNKMLIFEKEAAPNRIKMILVKEKLGF